MKHQTQSEALKDGTVPYYTCVDNRDIIDCPECEEIPGQSDLSINGHSYRRLDGVFMAWLHSRILAASKHPRTPTETKTDLQEYLLDLNATGVKPVDARMIPNGYAKPTIAEDTSWLLDVVW